MEKFRLSITQILIILTFQFHHLHAGNCTYYASHENHKYSCDLTYAHVLLNDSTLTIDGEHLHGHNDDDLLIISITHSIIHYLKSDIFEKFVNLEEIYVYNAEVNEISKIQNCDKLQIFYIENAEITQIASKLFENCQQMSEVSFIDCQLKSLPSDVFDNTLQVLDLSYNELNDLSSVTLSGMIRLIDLNLAENKIEEISFGELIELKILNLSGNRVKFYDGIFGKLINLEELHVCDNSLSEITNDTFKNLENLKILDLTNNSISELPVNAFASLINLKNLYLDSNKIKTLSSASFGRHNFTRIFTIDSNLVNAIQSNFFERFPILEYFHATNNECINDYIDGGENAIDFDDGKVWHLLSDCYYNYEPFKGFSDPKYLILLWSGLGVAVGMCMLFYVLHIYFKRSLERKEMENSSC